LRCIIRIFQKVSRKIGFTETESRIILFVLCAFLVGIVVLHFKETTGNENLLQFDYSEQDKLFYEGVPTDESVDSEKTQKARKGEFEKDFSSSHVKKISENKSPANVGVINLNKATREQLITLPGIGLKTANAIIDFKLRNGNFKSVNDLTNVKGIGKAKLEKIRTYIYVEEKSEK
jgi:competence protein ComEA